MSYSSLCVRLAGVSLCLSSAVFAEAASSNDKSLADPNVIIQQTLSDALKLQDDTAASVANGSEKSDAAILRLKGLDSPSGLKMADRGGDFAMAAIGVGNRLHAMNKSADAVKFFTEAEKALVLVISKLSDSSAQEKAMLLQHLAFIRAYHLDQATQAKKDFDAAIRLQPKDEALRQLRDGFLSQHADLTTSDSSQSAK